MTAIITEKFKIFLAEKFKEAFETAVDKNLYLFIGKPLEWADEDAPDTPLDTVDLEYKVWDDIEALKKISAGYVSHAVPRIDWDATGETVYVPYSDVDSDLYHHPTIAEINDGIANSYTAGSFYVMTDTYDVYKCIWNGGAENKSTVKPTGTSLSIFETADGYQWKYMYTVSAGDALKFMTVDWMPVKTLESDDSSQQWQVQTNAIDGGIHRVTITDGGTGYTNTDTGVMQSGSTSTTAKLRAGASAVDDIYNGATVYITAGTGAGQFREITDYTGATKVADVSPAWSTVPDNTSNYDVLPTLTFTGDGTNASAKPTVVAGEITEVDMTNVGADYRSAAIEVSGCYDNIGTVATLVPVMSPRGGHGYNPVFELGGNFITINVLLEYDEGSGDFPTLNEYRRIGIIANVLDDTDNIATATTLRASKVLTLSSISGTFTSDEIITGPGGVQGKVIQFNDLGGGNGTIHFMQDITTLYGTFTAGGLTGTDSGATATIDSVADSEAKKNSGDLIYVEHRRKVVRDISQLEDIKLIVEL